MFSNYSAGVSVISQTLAPALPNKKATQVSRFPRCGNLAERKRIK
jgi:hypothetical protein